MFLTLLLWCLFSGRPHQISGNSPGSSNNENKVLELAPLLNAIAIGEKKENSICGGPSSPTSVENGGDKLTDLISFEI